MADLRNAIWFIQTEPNETVADPISISGGGICIDSRGFILTVAHIVSFDDVEQKDCFIDASPYNSTESFTVVRVEIHTQFDLALLQVRRENGNDDPIPHVDLANSVQVGFGENVFGYVHQGCLSYSLCSGYTCFPLPGEVYLPDINDTTTINSYPSFNKNNWVTSDNYRTLGSVIRPIDKSLFDYHPRLPLVQVKGYFPSHGTSGCPLFKSNNNELIGLASCEINDYLFIIPVNFLRKYYDIVKWDILPNEDEVTSSSHE